MMVKQDTSTLAWGGGGLLSGFCNAYDQYDHDQQYEHE